MTGTAVRVACLLAHGAVLAGTASAQVRGSLDVGAGTYRPDRAIPGGIASVAPALTFEHDAFRLGAAGVYSDAPAGRWNFQGSAFAQVRSPHSKPYQLEATGRLEMTRHFAARGVNVATGELRAYVRPFSPVAVWVGHSRGTALTLGSRRPLQRNLIGASARVAGVEVGLSIASSTFELMGGPPRTGSGTQAGGILDTLEVGSDPLGGAAGRTSRRLSLTDASLSSRWRLAGVDFDLAVGRRFARDTPELTIWGVSASRDLTSGLALVAGAGRAGFDPLTAVPGARYVVMGLRLKVGPPVVTGPAPLRETAAGAPFHIGPSLPAGREVVVRAPGASQVELAGDFTDWRPVALQPSADGAWRAVLPIHPGVHRLAVRIDRGEWQAPPGSHPIPSEFGGEVTEVVVE